MVEGWSAFSHAAISHAAISHATTRLSQDGRVGGGK
jgi:hypothetical protein